MLARAASSRAAGGLARRLAGPEAACSSTAPAVCTTALHTSTAAAPAAVAAAAAADPSSSGSGTSAWGWRAACAALLGLAGSAVVGRADPGHLPPPDADHGFSLMPLEQRRRVFFKYEKRIRELSPPEKVFEYFASIRGNKVFDMTAGDMMRSVVPVFPPEGSQVIRAGSLPGEPSPQVDNSETSKFIAQFDLDGDDRLSFDEFLLFQTLLAIPVQDIEVAFRVIDKDASGKVSREEFAHLLDALHAQAGKPSMSLRKSVHTSSQDLGGLMAHFFGADGRKQLTQDAFRAFLVDLRQELVRLEFNYYDWKRQGSISARDFAHSVVACARMKHVDQYLDKVEHMPPELAALRVTLPEFQQFRQMWRQLHLLSVALEFVVNTTGDHMQRGEFVWTVNHVMSIQLDPKLVDILFYLFADDQGRLNIQYMYQVMNRHVTTGLNVAYRFNKPPAAKSYFDCIRECKSKTGI